MKLANMEHKVNLNRSEHLQASKRGNYLHVLHEHIMAFMKFKVVRSEDGQKTVD